MIRSAGAPGASSSLPPANCRIVSRRCPVSSDRGPLAACALGDTGCVTVGSALHLGPTYPRDAAADTSVARPPVGFVTDSLISVILPTYNRSPLLRQAVESVREQTYRQWELPVIDDGSADDTAGQLVGEPRIGDWARAGDAKLTAAISVATVSSLPTLMAITSCISEPSTPARFP